MACMRRGALVEQITANMREQGLKVTHPRKRIIEVLSQAKQPLSADEVCEKIANLPAPRRTSAINRTTVYRTLTTLEHADCVSRFTFQNKHVYEMATTHSHYLICRGCKKVERIPFCTLHNIEKASLKSSKQFASVDHHTLQLSGMCKQCV